MALFTLGNLLAWQAPSYESLILARIVTGLAHGVFFSIGSTIATSLVPKEKAASATVRCMPNRLRVLPALSRATDKPCGSLLPQFFGGAL